MARRQRSFIHDDAPEWVKYDLPGWMGLMLVVLIVAVAALSVLVSSRTGISGELIALPTFGIIFALMSWLIPRHGRRMPEGDPRIKRPE